MKSNNGYWANKYGYQIGYKFLDFLDVIGLNTNLEYNLVRPYTHIHIGIAHHMDIMHNH